MHGEPLLYYQTFPKWINYAGSVPKRVPERSVDDLSGMLNKAGHVLETKLTSALAEIGITPRMQCVLLNALEAERTQSQLAELANLDKTTMVTTADALEKAGLAERRTSASDRRVRIIGVTPAGARVAARAQKIVDRVHEDVLAGLPPRERSSFVKSLTLVFDECQNEPGSSTPGPRRRRRSV